MDGMGSGGVPGESMPLSGISAISTINQEGGRPADATETQFRLDALRRLIGSRQRDTIWRGLVKDECGERHRIPLEGIHDAEFGVHLRYVALAAMPWSGMTV